MYDVIVIGAGAAGLGASGAAATFGLKTLLIEKKAFNVGGDCLNYGCVPSKALLHVAQQFQSAKSAERFGLQSSGKADWGKVIQYIHDRQDIIRKRENVDYLREEFMMEIVIGTARFVRKDTVVVNEQEYRGKYIILATGSRARTLKVEGRDKVTHLYNNESLFWEMKSLPERLLIVGGGPIGCEMAQAFQRLGSQVTIVNKGERILEKEQAEFSQILAEGLSKEGITILHETEVTGFADEHTALLSGPDGETKMTFDTVLEAIGREVRTEELNLAQAQIEVKEGKIVTDPYYRTSNAQVYAIGDAYGEEKFSHGAEMHNFDLYTNLLSPFKTKHSLKNFSWVTFTEPAIATFGWSEKQLQEKGIDFDKIEQDFLEDDRAIVDEYRYGKLILYISKSWIPFRKQTVLGGSMIAPAAGELVQELILAMKAYIPVSAFTRKIYPYPVASRINQKAIRTYNQKGLLTPFVKKIIRGVFRYAPW